MLKLQEELHKVHSEIQKQKTENEKVIKEKEEQIQRQIEYEEVEAKRKKDRILLEYNNNAKDVKEANEICKMLGKKIKFKQCIVQ